MDYELSQHWIDTFSDNDWNNASLSQYWHQLYNLGHEETLWENNALNTALMAKYKITERDLGHSLMYLANTVATSNPRPAIWSLQQMKQALPQVFSNEYATCFHMVANNHPHMLIDFVKMGGGAEELEEIFKKMNMYSAWHLLPYALERFVVHKDDYRIYRNLTKKMLYPSIGLEDGKFSGELKIDWLFTEHIQNAMRDIDLFESLWSKIVQMYPHPYAVDAITKYINSPHHSTTCNVSLLASILNKPMQEQNFDLIRTMADKEEFFKNLVVICVEREWSLTNHDVIVKLLSFGNNHMIEQAFEKVCQKNSLSILSQANRLCEWVEPQLHAKITKMSLSSLCKNHPHLYNNLQKMALISELHTETKPKSRKM